MSVAVNQPAVYGRAAAPAQMAIESGGITVSSTANVSQVGVSTRAVQSLYCTLCKKEAINITRFEDAENPFRTLMNARTVHKNIGCSPKVEHTMETLDPHTGAVEGTVTWTTGGCCKLGCSDKIANYSKNGAVVGQFITPGPCTQLLNPCSTRVTEFANPSGHTEYIFRRPCIPCLTSTQLMLKNKSDEDLGEVHGYGCVTFAKQCIMGYSAYHSDSRIPVANLKPEAREIAMVGTAFVSQSQAGLIPLYPY